MAVIVKSANSSWDADSTLRTTHITGDLFAAEDLTDLTPCYISSVNGKAYQCVDSGTAEQKRIAGYTARKYKQGEAITLWEPGLKGRYSEGLLTAGQPIYMGGAGQLLDAAGGDATPVAQAIDKFDIRFIRWM